MEVPGAEDTPADSELIRGRSPIKNLTQRWVDAHKHDVALADPEGRYEIRDATVTGLILRVGIGRERHDDKGRATRATTKVYILRFTPKGGRQRRERIGPTVDTDLPGKQYTLDGARAEAQRRIGRARDGVVQHRAMRVAALFSYYLANHVSRKKKLPASADRDTVRRFKTIEAEIGDLPIDQVSHVEVSRVLATIEAPYECNRVRALIRNAWNEARVWGFLPADRANPVEGTKVHREKVRDVRALKPAEVARLLAAAGKHPNPWAGACIALLALTGCRANEIMSLRWDDVDLREGTITLRDRKAGDTLTLPLSDAAIDVLERVPRQAGSVWCFPGRLRGQHMDDLRVPWAAVLKVAELPSGTRLHDLRAALATATALKHGAEVTRQLLGHDDVRTTARYLRPAKEDLRKAINAHGRAVTGKPVAKARRKRAAKSAKAKVAS